MGRSRVKRVASILLMVISLSANAEGNRYGHGAKPLSAMLEQVVGRGWAVSMSKADGLMGKQTHDVGLP